MNIANEAYHEWRRLNPKDDSSEEEPTDDNAEGDAANLRSAVRVLRMGKDADYLDTVLFPGGEVSPARVRKAAEGDRAEELNMLPLKRISFLGNNE